MLKTVRKGGWAVGSHVNTNIQDRNHDALLAHALVIALKEYRQDNGFILNRAEELMRDWGYTDETT